MKSKFILWTILAVAIISTIALLFFMDYSKDQEIKNSNKRSIQMALVAYNSIINTNKIAATSYHTNLMENQKAMEILKRFKYETNKEEQTFLRGELFRLFNKRYKTFKSLGIRQFHFHTHEGKSLLRFHRPYINGDSLINIRESIEFTNTQLKPFFGFEGGRIFPGFRYVFPIVYKGDHLGSVEFSIPFEVIENKLQSVLPKIGYQLHLNKRISYDKVFDKYKEFFIPSPLLKDHYVENTIISNVENKLATNELIGKIQTSLRPLVEKYSTNLKNNVEENFSVSTIVGNNGYRANIISIEENNGKDAAHLVCYCKFDELLVIEQKYLIFKVLIVIAALIIVALLYVVLTQIDKMKRKNQNIQQLLDTQDNIVILTNGEEINFANLKFFSFLGFEDLDDFKKHHKCICEHFNQNDKFFHLGKISKDENWVNIIQTLPHSQRVVSMLSNEFKIHAFSVTISKFDDHLTLITFTDISQTMLNYIKLEEQTIHDKLTRALNREYFEQNYEKLLVKYHTKSSYFAIAMLDIDYFKAVNDTYGHDVGDAVLVQFVKTIEKYSREDDILIRWGGEEFILVLKVFMKENLIKALEHIRKVIEMQNFPKVGQKTCSIGGTIYIDGEQIEETIKRADIGVYEAKANGRNQVVIK